MRTISLSGQPSASRNALLTPARSMSTPPSTMFASRSTTTTMLGIACINVLVMSRSRCSWISRCLRSVTSRPLTRRSRRSSTAGRRMHDHSTESRRPLFVTQVLSWSPTVSPAATRCTSPAHHVGLLRDDVVAPRTPRPPVSSGVTSSSRSNALLEPRGSITPFSSISRRRLGALLAIVFRNSRSRSRAAASSWRAVMSMPPATIPLASAGLVLERRGAPEHDAASRRVG